MKKGAKNFNMKYIKKTIELTFLEDTSFIMELHFRMINKNKFEMTHLRAFEPKYMIFEKNVN